MKLTKENYELLMFDLLEGNLPEKDAMDLMTQIEADDFFFREWNLFKSTILQPDEGIVFENKDSLLKSEDRVIPLRIFYRAAVAASILLLIGFFVNRIDSTEEIATHSDPELIEDKQETPVVQETPVEQVEENIAPTVVKDQPSPERIERSQSKEAFVDPIQEERKEIVQEEPETRPVLDLDPAVDAPESVVLDNIAENQPMGESQSPQEIDMPEPENSEQVVTYSRVDRIRGIMAGTVSKLKHPKLSFKPDWQDRSFEFAFETDGYAAVATINPFNKNK